MITPNGIELDILPGETILPITNKIVDDAIEGRYFISDFGNVYSTYRSPMTGSYRMKYDKSSVFPTVRLCTYTNKSKHVLVYRLVMKAFNPVPNMNNLEVGHKDGNLLNNRLDNLFWREGSYLNHVHNSANPFIDLDSVYEENKVILPLSDLIIPNVKPIYLVSNYGNVYSISGNSNRKLIDLKKDYTRDGYERVSIYTNDGKSKHYFVHRLVLLVFRYRPDHNQLFVNHKDRVVTHNYVDPDGIIENDNIEWCTPEYNSNYMVYCGTARNQYSTDVILQILEDLKNNIPVKDIAERYGVSLDTIYGLKNNKSYKSIIGGGMDQWRI